MSGLRAFALGAAPLAGGVLLGDRGPRATECSGFASRHQIGNGPAGADSARPGHPSSRAEQVIAQHIDDLVVAIEKSRHLQRSTSYFVENWRHLVLFLTTVLFSVVAWHTDHNRPVWLPIFIAATLLSVVTALFVLRGFLRHVRPAPHGDHDHRHRRP